MGSDSIDKFKNRSCSVEYSSVLLYVSAGRGTGNGDQCIAGL